MSLNLRDIIKNYPFAFLLFLIGAGLGYLIAEELGLARGIYSQIRSPFEFDPTGGMINNLLFVYPITFIIDALVSGILGLLLGILGFIFIDKKRKLSPEEKCDMLIKKIEKAENKKSKLEKELVKLEREKLNLKKKKDKEEQSL